MQNQITDVEIPEPLRIAAAGRFTLPTEEAAFHANLKPQTLHKWSALGNGRISPVRQGNRLGWKVTDIARLLTGEV